MAMTIGVWVGRPDGAPVAGLVGRVAAAPLLFDAFARTGKLPAPLAAAPRDVLVAATAKLPPPLQRPPVLPGEVAKPQLRITCSTQRSAARTRQREVVGPTRSRSR
jgi:penicillin-binding protein 1C